jgi:hypothetical protein
MCVATQASLFKGRIVVIGTTDRRLLIQPLSRRFEPTDPVVSVPPERLADAVGGETQRQGIEALADWFAPRG